MTTELQAAAAEIEQNTRTEPDVPSSDEVEEAFGVLLGFVMDGPIIDVVETLRAHITTLEADNKQLHKALKGMLEVFADDTGDCEDLHTVIAARLALAQSDGKVGE